MLDTMRADVCGIGENTASEVVGDFVGKLVLIDPRIRCWRYPADRSKIGYPGSGSNGGIAEFKLTDYRQVQAVDCGFPGTEPGSFSTSPE